jgi:hypothetical protein
MRRAVPSFTVEVRRRPRLPISSNPGAQPSQSKPLQAATASGAKKMDPSPVDVATSRPTGRILPSLVPDEPRHRLLEDATVPAADSEPPLRASKRPAVRAAKQGEQASKSLQSSIFSSDENVPLAERLSTKSHRTSGTESGEGAGATPEDRTRAPSPIVGDASSLVLTAKGRKRTIMARYVFSNEDKPGERWKRRVLRSR